MEMLDTLLKITSGDHCKNPRPPPILSTWIFLLISADFRVKISAIHPLKVTLSSYFSEMDTMTLGARYKLCAIASSKCCE